MRRGRVAAPSAQTLRRLADETDHQASTLEKVLRLLDLLHEIARDRVLADRLVNPGPATGHTRPRGAWPVGRSSSSCSSSQARKCVDRPPICLIL